jgi:hypothetical protein
MKLAEIFETVGLNAEEIRAAVAGVSVPALRPVEDRPDDRPRPTCLYCGKRIGRCISGRRPATGQGAWP